MKDQPGLKGASAEVKAAHAVKVAAYAQARRLEWAETVRAREAAQKAAGETPQPVPGPGPVSGRGGVTNNGAPTLLIFAVVAFFVLVFGLSALITHNTNECWRDSGGHVDCRYGGKTYQGK